MKKIVYANILTFVLAGICSLFIISCSDSSQAPTGSSSKDSTASGRVTPNKTKIYIIPKENKSEYWQIVLDGARNAAEDLEIELVEKSPKSESDVEAQENMLDDAIVANPDAIVIAPSDSGALVPGIEAAMDEKIPVIIIDSKADTNQVTAFLASDNFHIGALAADEMAKALTAKFGKAEGKIACITFLSGAASLEKRKKGFEDRIHSEYPGIEIVSFADAKGKHGETVKLLNEILKKNRDLKGVFTNNQITGEETVQVLKNLKRKDLAVVVVDYGKDEIWGLKNGFVDSMIVQKPWMIGYMGIDAAVRATKGEELDKFIDTGVVPISPKMIKENGAEEFLNPIEFNKRDEKEISL